VCLHLGSLFVLTVHFGEVNKEVFAIELNLSGLQFGEICVLNEIESLLESGMQSLVLRGILK
jgi:hypothetical protein